MRDILKIAQEPVLLETPIGEGKDSRLGDFISDEGATDPSEDADQTMLWKSLTDALGRIPERKASVLSLRKDWKTNEPAHWSK